MSGRPRPAEIRGEPASSSPGTPMTMACSTEETCSTHSRTGVVDAVPAGTRSATSRRGADRFARHHDEPDIEGGIVDDDPVQAVADLERDAPAVVLEVDPAIVPADLEARPAKDERPVRVVLELVLGVDPAADPDVAWRPAARATASATLTWGVEARSRPTRYRGP